MKTINTYISEKLVISKSSMTKAPEYHYHPKDKDELKELIEKLINERGNDADLNDIDVSKITDMSALFDSSYLHNIRNVDISEWDVSNVTNMTEMFSDCEDFNCDLSKWDVSNVEKMNYMFYNCKSFNSDISKWNVSKVRRWNAFSDNSPLQNNPPKWYKK